MKINQWTMGLAAVGVVSLASAVNADESTMNPIYTALSATTISGYVDTSVEWFENDYTGGSFPLSIPFRGGANKADGFNLNVVKLTIEKPMDESEWAAGYKVDLLFGPDAVGYNAAVGGGGDLGIKQAYVALRTPVGNGIDWKIGTFDTIIGYEVFEAGNNPNFSRSYGYSIEPTQHEGVLASYRVSDSIALAAGVANSLTPGLGVRDTSNGTSSYWNKTWMLSGALTAPEDMGFLSGSTLYAGYVSGFAGGPDTQNNLYVGGTMNTPVTGLKAGVAFDYVDNLFGTAGGPDAWTLAGYLSFQATEKLSLHGRLEYGELEFAGIDGEMWSLTATAQYDLWANVISRVEFRYDDVDVNIPGFSEDTAGIFANLIYTF
jgi:hypothetical protein